ncbi:MAG: hypothetical protein WC607_00855 [Candidatus Micrarchaeia archaeon]
MKRLLAFLLLAACVSAYTDYSFSMSIRVGESGNAHVIEKSVFMLDKPEEVQSFEYYLLQGETTLIDWQRFSKNIRYHLAGGLSDLRIIAAREFNLGYTAASVSIEYDVEGLFLPEPVNSRATRYSLDNKKLSFGVPDELSLGTGHELRIALPDDAFNVEIVPAGGVAQKDHNEYSWTGPLIGSWDVSFQREASLSQEVKDFFSDAYVRLTESYLWLLGLLLVAIVALKFVKLRE